MSKKTRFVSPLVTKIAALSGKPAPFALSIILVVSWALLGSHYRYSASWQLVINTSTGILTFLMVFVMQNSQNRDSKALQAKLDVLILTSQAENTFIGIENLDEEQLLEMGRSLASRAESLEEKADEKAEKRQIREEVGA